MLKKEERVRRKLELYARIEAWQFSGLPQNKYSEQEGINLCVFKYWLSKYRLEQA